ncbi:CHASE domain-containing protein [Coraliomargarita sp. SDUM461004]|uniref:histidine kinase n=1 Tax=Thalassobacterium sedimentorum TaxID=3041258 RepID=A0ABU1AG92_9BACT|nr:CHASE domain-containing protein [Coraliomargarita sp. SDUM461004]MDQ8193188.1 CHASE domain-containing protein [Coraliomargarita sp. SDUM461004]
MIGRIPSSPPLAEKIQAHPILLNLLTTLIYGAMAAVGFCLTKIEGNISPIWPASGFAVATIYMGGYRLLPGILFGAFIANSLNDVSAFSALIISISNCCEALIAGWLLNRARSLGSQLGQYTTPTWILASALIAPIITATIGSFSILYLNTNAEALPFWQVTLTWFAGDAIGILIITPAILSFKWPSFTKDWCLKLLSLCILTALVYALIFFYQYGNPFLFLVFFLLIPACRWFGPAGCAYSTLCFVVFVSIAIATKTITAISTASYYELLALDIILLALSVTSLTIASFYKKGHFRAPTLMLTIGWLISGLIYYTLESASTKIDQKNFVELVNDIEFAVTDRLQTYVDALIAAAGIYINSEELRPEEWHTYVEHLNLVKRYPGINGLGFIQPLNKAELADFVAHKRASGLPDFEIKEVPGVERPPVDAMGYEHYIITYIEPYKANSKALGLDVASEINRQTAGQRARDTGLPTMTERITLVQDGMERPGFLIFFPMYRSGAPTETISQRRAAFIGWSYAPFITEVFLNGVLGNRENQIHFEIYDSITISPSTFVYSTTGQTQHSNSSDFANISSLDLCKQTFTFGWNPGDAFQKQETTSATIAAASLSLGSCLLVVIVVNLQSTNRRAQRIVEERTLELSAINEKLQREVSDREKAELEAREAHKAANEANLAKSEFLATMSHEIRTPMNSVIGFAELLCGSELKTEQRLWATYIQSSGNSLLSLINDILDFSKIEAGKLELEAIPFSISDCLNEVVCSLEPIAAQKGLLINLETSAALPEKVIGDPIRLKQVVTNLVGNSIKFTAKGSIVVTATWTGSPQNGVAEIFVRDSGIGIPKEKIGHLFERFSQVDSSTTRQYGGTGLGLAICKRIVNLMNGQIQVENTNEKGTTIKFNIPFTAAKAIELKKNELRKATQQSQNHASNKLQVLVVDDNAVNRKLAETVIRRLGHEVDTANDGIDAIEHVTKRFYDIAFLDCQMPKLDGFDATRRIRQLEAQGQVPGSHPDKKLPIIALTANASEKDRIACIECGMDSYICKPARIKDFESAFKQLADSQRTAST